VPVPRDTPALLVVSGRGRDAWLLSSLLAAVLDNAEQEVFVEWVPTLAKAVTRLKERAWQACLLDEHVGDDTGLDVLRRAREQGIRVPMVLCMAHEDKTLEDIALEAGAAEVVALSATSAKELGRLLHAAMVRGRAEGRVRSDGDRFARLFEESPMPMTVTTLDEGRFLEANAAFCKLIGHPREDVVGHTVHELGLWAEERTRTAFRARLRQMGTVDGLETVLQDRQGRLVHVVTTARVVTFDGTQAILSLTMDITGSRRAEAELARREVQLEAAEEAAGSGSWDLETTSGQMRWSPHLERLLGLADAPRTLDGYLSRVVAEDRSRVEEAFRRSTQRGAPLKVRHTVLDADGRRLEVELRGMPEFDVQDEPIAISGTVQPLGTTAPRRPRAVPHVPPPDTAASASPRVASKQ
jgi:PAS domain S-box-containing protein